MEKEVGLIIVILVGYVFCFLAIYLRTKHDSSVRFYVLMITAIFFVLGGLAELIPEGLNILLKIFIFGGAALFYYLISKVADRSEEGDYLDTF